MATATAIRSNLPKCPHGVYLGGSADQRARYCGLCTADPEAEPKAPGRFKTCERCSKTKPLSEFHSAKKGLAASCKECRPLNRTPKGFRKLDQCRTCGVPVAPPTKYCGPCSTPEAAARREEEAARVRAERWLLRPDRYGVGTLTLENWRQKVAAANWRCSFCGRPLDEATAVCVRVVPVTQGGKNDIENCVPSCQPCKNRASARARWKKPVTDA
jgi:hypothetical protein